MIVTGSALLAVAVSILAFLAPEKKPGSLKRTEGPVLSYTSSQR
jgi:hypothetical protein